jgi:hypothetical protein
MSDAYNPLAIMPATDGWVAVYFDRKRDRTRTERVVCWALCEPGWRELTGASADDGEPEWRWTADPGSQRVVVGMVRSPWGALEPAESEPDPDEPFFCGYCDEVNESPAESSAHRMVKMMRDRGQKRAAAAKAAGAK